MCVKRILYAQVITIQLAHAGLDGMETTGGRSETLACIEPFHCAHFITSQLAQAGLVWMHTHEGDSEILVRLEPFLDAVLVTPKPARVGSDRLQRLLDSTLCPRSFVIFEELLNL